MLMGELVLGGITEKTPNFTNFTKLSQKNVSLDKWSEPSPGNPKGVGSHPTHVKIF